MVTCLIKKILVATDFSENANRALDKALELADKLNASVTLLKVITVFIKEQEHRQALTEAVNKAKHENPNIAINELIDYAGENPAGIIIKIAEDFDLVVVGHRGLSGLQELFMGSVSERVVHLSRKPVLVVP